MLSAALRQSVSTGSLASSPATAAIKWGSSSGLAAGDEPDELGHELLFDEDSDGPDRNCRSALSAPSPLAPSARAASDEEDSHHPGGAAQQRGGGSAAPTKSVGWTMPPQRGGSSGGGSNGTASGGGHGLLSRSLPRPISGPQLNRLGYAPADDDGGDGGFVPPHLASSMIEHQITFGQSLSTAKGAAGLRLRHEALRRTGFLEGNIGVARGPGAEGGE